MYNIKQVAEMIGVSYTQIYYALATKRVPEPKKVGNVRAFSISEVAVLQNYFKEMEKGKHAQDAIRKIQRTKNIRRAN